MLSGLALGVMLGNWCALVLMFMHVSEMKKTSCLVIYATSLLWFSVWPPS